MRTGRVRRTRGIPRNDPSEKHHERKAIQIHQRGQNERCGMRSVRL